MPSQQFLVGGPTRLGFFSDVLVQTGKEGPWTFHVTLLVPANATINASSGFRIQLADFKMRCFWAGSSHGIGSKRGCKTEGGVWGECLEAASEARVSVWTKHDL